MTTAENIDQYISLFPKDVQKLLEHMRQVIRKSAPEATEVISYGMPAFKAGSVLVYFAAYKNHIGFYPTSSGIRVFQKELAAYKTSKGAVQFPLNKSLPIGVISKIVKFRIQEDAENVRVKKMKKAVVKKKIRP